MKKKKKTVSKKRKRSKKGLAELESQYSALMAETQNSTNPMIRDNARDLEARMDQFKAGQVGVSQVRETIAMAVATIKAEQEKVVAQTPVDRTPNLHETEAALELLQVGLKMLPLLLL